MPKGLPFDERAYWLRMDAAERLGAADERMHGPQDEDARLAMHNKLAGPQLGLAHRALGVQDGEAFHLNRPLGYQSASLAAQREAERRRYLDIHAVDPSLPRQPNAFEEADRLDALLLRLRRPQN